MKKTLESIATAIAIMIVGAGGTVALCVLLFNLICFVVAHIHFFLIAAPIYLLICISLAVYEVKYLKQTA